MSRRDPKDALEQLEQDELVETAADVEPDTANDEDAAPEGDDESADEEAEKEG